MNRLARAFTLIELLVVIGIIGMLVSILMPSFVAVSDLARETTCLNNLKLLSQAAKAYILENRGMLPKNDSETVTYEETDEMYLLPGQDSTMKWWCNKVYQHGVMRKDIYICPSDPGRASDEDPVQCGYGFNNTLTDPAPGDAVKTLYEIEDTERTAIIGHCSDYSREPLISEEMVLKSSGEGQSADFWPRGHMAKYDREAKMVAGRCGFIMASGAWVVRTFSDAVRLKNEDGELVLFHK
jgi:prepilin-type N-terminal cleavage/methylation domain-containing protein